MNIQTNCLSVLDRFVRLVLKVLSIGYVVTVTASCIKCILKILDFYNVKSCTFAKLANLATISKKSLFKQTYIRIFA